MPNIDEGAYVAPSATVEGDVTIAADCSVWPGAVIRGDEDVVVLGAGSNVQDNATIHMDEGNPVRIGENVTIGHNAIVHGCNIGDNTIIGMGAIVLDKARIGRDCIIGAAALVTHGTEVPDGHMAFGSPAKVIRALKPEEVEGNAHNAQVYIDLARKKMM